MKTTCCKSLTEQPFSETLALILPGQDWKTEIASHLHNSDVVVLLVSQHYWFIRRKARAGLKKADMLIPLGVASKAPNREVSMSTSLLYHAFGIRGYQYIRTDYQDGQTIFTIHQEPETCRCSACGSARGQVARSRRAALPNPAHRQPDHVRRPAHPARRVPGLWRGAPGQGPLRRPQAELHQGLRALRPGTVAQHDHPRRGPAPRRQLGH